MSLGIGVGKIMTKVFFFALTINLLGIATLYYSWKNKQRNKQLFSNFSWILLFVALLLWCEFSGWEFGIVYCLTISALIAWIFILYNRQQRPSRDRHQPQQFQRLQFVQIGHIFAKVLVVGPFAMLIFSTLSLSLIKWAPGSYANRLVFACFLWCLLWALFSCWVSATKKLFNPILCLLGIGISSNVVLFIL